MASQCCDLCGEPIGRQPWLLLNRYGVGTGKARCMSEVINGDEYLWIVGDDLETEQELVSGATLCWPTCAVAWIEGKMIGVDTEVRLRNHG